jgi:hypothetical protein
MEAMDDVVYSWKEYTTTGAHETSPVSSIDIEETTFGGLKAASWEGSFSCCTTTLCSDCTIE